uniref:U1-pseudomyrmecitoxin-Pt1 subunit LS2 n=1 Tax=Pseudomyrmex triplarinus TaxID=600763 RepID=TXLS2_PSETR|nr:RecName: Full=U1-pseudomyrmecitoxin-Pt1 subunit LS2; Short=U1-PSDTX-Pt1 subunit LS2; AltName: Full=Myrmexin I subunit LS2/Myrmexin III subunit LS2/Myrmexin IV subunit LS2; AltName: Full=U1-pseudomyrmecitoxin-Pt1a subunit LS2/U1-pseudomyrmecitoxin-Pt1c subunit LS2/U1-pseudomyrmecitoxin-Pt1d subunit LS2; Short=U1-PSDTX-Pt1a subunit LS2/U1-PSDTX-Pt1c subunit LS2/U1-PSDTX-Pt1d subunit LS2 [Pseudomyrmex triplarinus]
ISLAQIKKLLQIIKQGLKAICDNRDLIAKGCQA